MQFLIFVPKSKHLGNLFFIHFKYIIKNQANRINIKTLLTKFKTYNL